LRATFAKTLEDIWYGGGRFALLLAPLAWIYRVLLYVHKSLAMRRREGVSVPIVVVGNITVGGTGKTPIVIWLVERLREQGFAPGIVTRGYLGAGSADEPVQVFPHTSAAQAGDEAVLLARRLKCPVVACRNRLLAARSLVENGAIDVIVSDDGLQHYSLRSDFDIVVVDGARGLGNGRLLPAGPLREPSVRLDSADLILVNGPAWARPDALRFELSATDVVQLSDGSRLPLSAFAGRRVHAAAAIGNPERFFAMLRSAGCIVDAHAWPDHAQIPLEKLNFADDAPVLITEKDAVKCPQAMPAGVWSVNVDVKFEESSRMFVLREVAKRICSDAHG
jgi:tetraacyldisaccharide 4'-kinase